MICLVDEERSGTRGYRRCVIDTGGVTSNQNRGERNHESNNQLGGGKQGMDVTIMRSLGYVEWNISYLDKHDPREKCRKQRLASKDRGAKPVDLFDENQIDEKTEEWKDGSSNYSKETQTTTVPTTLACRVFLPDFTEASFFRIKKCRIKTKRMLTN